MRKVGLQTSTAVAELRATSAGAGGVGIFTVPTAQRVGAGAGAMHMIR